MSRVVRTQASAGRRGWPDIAALEMRGGPPPSLLAQAPVFQEVRPLSAGHRACGCAGRTAIATVTCPLRTEEKGPGYPKGCRREGSQLRPLAEL